VAGDEATLGAEFQGTDPELFRRALTVLESQGKARIFSGSTSAEDGVKFFEVGS
jgi:hypothetical protein